MRNMSPKPRLVVLPGPKLAPLSKSTTFVGPDFWTRILICSVGLLAEDAYPQTTETRTTLLAFQKLAGIWNEVAKAVSVVPMVEQTRLSVVLNCAFSTRGSLPLMVPRPPTEKASCVVS